MKLLLFLLLPLVGCGQTAKDRAVAGEAYAREQVRQAVREPANLPATVLPTKVLPTKQVAVAAAEAILFPIYGQHYIENERPYKVYFIDGYWYIAGTLPAGYDGGTFEIVLRAADGQVLCLTHGK